MSNIDLDLVRYPGEKEMQALVHWLGGIGWVIVVGVFVLITATGGLGFSTIYLVAVVGYLFLWPLIRENAQIAGNGLLLSSKQYPEIYGLLEEFWRKFEIQDLEKPEIYLVQERRLNAYTLPAFSHNRIVLLSDLVESLSEPNNMAELKVILGHELGHHLIKQVDYWWLDLPVRFFPLSLLGLYHQRLAELTADRIGYLFSESLSDWLMAYRKIIAGPKLGAAMDDLEYQKQQQANDRSVLMTVANLFNSHPFFTKRVAELQSFHYDITHSV